MSEAFQTDYPEDFLQKVSYTYADLAEWPESIRAELHGGELRMPAAPSPVHQEISSNLHGTIWNFLKGKPCKVYSAPFDVRLFPKEDLSDNIVVQPDLSVVCDSSRIDSRGCAGAPDMVIEILSPANTSYDILYKYDRYLKAGVREYWLIDPEKKLLTVHLLEQGRYTVSYYGLKDSTTPYPKDADIEKFSRDIAPVSILPGLSIDLKTIFPV
jgi:Uma2 family endonuclease